MSSCLLVDGIDNFSSSTSNILRLTSSKPGGGFLLEAFSVKVETLTTFGAAINWETWSKPGGGLLSSCALNGDCSGDLSELKLC